jgi:O-antigen ligase
MDESHTVLDFLNINMPYIEFHNGYLEMAVRGGLVGFVLFVAMLASIFRSSMRLRRSDPVSATIVLILFSGVLVQNVAESTFTQVMDQPWSLLICLWVMNEYQLMNSSDSSKRASSAVQPKRAVARR